jgi:hypothetical protein
MQQQISKFLRCIEEQRFYDAHEVFEEVWFPRRFEKNGEVELLKGFINAAVSFELYKRKRYHQSKKVWKNYLKYRQLLYKLQTPYTNEYHQLVRYLDSYNKSLKTH